MAYVLQPNAVPKLQDQSSGDRNALYLYRSRRFILLPAGVSAATGAPNWQGGWVMAPGYYGLAFDDEWIMMNTNPAIFYTQVGGTLPPGLSVSNVGTLGGKISGTPTALGTYNFTLRAQNDDGFSEQAFAITISSIPVSGFV